MQRNKIPILCTRPLSPQLIAVGEENGLQIDIVPFIRTESLVSTDVSESIRSYSFLQITAVFTSMNAAESVIHQLSGVKPLWRIFCLGNTTRSTLVNHFGEESIAGFAEN